MKTRSIFLLLIFISSLVPYQVAQADQELKRSPDDALAFLYLSDAVLTNQVTDDGTSLSPRVFSAPKPDLLLDVKTDLINQMINAAKAQRNDHYHKCNDSVNLHRERGEICEAEETKKFCEERYQQLTDKIAALRIVRGGDQRNVFTKGWHGIKRTGAKIWRGIGPLGRKFLREVGPEALKMVATGGVGSEQLFKNFVKHTAKKIGREQIRKIAYRAVQRLLKVRLEIAEAAGIDICKEEEESANEQAQTTPEEKIEEEDQEEELGAYLIRDTFDEAYASMEWEGFLPVCMHHQAEGPGGFIQLDIDLDEGTFSGTIAGVGEAHSAEFGWEGWGVYAVDGIEGVVYEAPDGFGYEFEGSGNADLTYRMEAWCDPPGAMEPVFTQDEKTNGGAAEVTGDFYVLVDTWYLNIYVIFNNGPARFHFSCHECELFPADQ
jgi:hypothetical protein